MATGTSPLTRPNLLLARLSPEEHERIRPHCERVDVALKTQLAIAGERIAHAWFPESMVASTLIELPEGESVEVGLVGNEGFVGLDLLFGATVSFSTVICQAEGTAVRIDAEAVRRELMAPNGAGFRIMLRYSRAFLGSVAQAGACSASHGIEQRFARWLLQMQDHVGSDRFVLTHEFAALMLAVRRASVTQAANALRLTGAIRYERGEVQVLDRALLQTLSCGCYPIMAALGAWTFESGDEGRGAH